MGLETASPNERGGASGADGFGFGFTHWIGCNAGSPGLLSRVGCWGKVLTVFERSSVI